MCLNLLESFEKYSITNKRVAVVGSETPWVEAILLNLNNKVTTIEYNVPETTYENLECKDYFNFFQENKTPFDAVISISSIEHSGLGRYGDPLDPEGDLKAMKVILNNLKPSGTLILSCPFGKDALVWNAHRIYGPVRLPLLIDGFTEIDWFGIPKQTLFNNLLKDNSDHAVMVLQKNND